MKKLLAMILALVMIFALAACGKTAAPAAAPAASEAPAEAAAPAEEAPAEEAPEEIIEEAEPVMTHEEFMMADMDSEVVVEGYISAVQQFSEEYGNTSLYLQDEDGAYFLYGAACSEEDYNKLVPGVKLLVNGYKSEWGGEVEITDAVPDELSSSSPNSSRRVARLATVRVMFTERSGSPDSVVVPMVRPEAKVTRSA